MIQLLSEHETMIMMLWMGVIGVIIFVIGGILGWLILTIFRKK